MATLGAAPSKESESQSVIDPSILSTSNPGSYEELHKKTKG